jgi:hypothetical protein
MFDNLIADIVKGIVRHIATAAGGWLVAQHILNCAPRAAAAGTCSDYNGFIGSVIFLGGVAWSAYEKFSRTH